MELLYSLRLCQSSEIRDRDDLLYYILADFTNLQSQEIKMVFHIIFSLALLIF